MKLIRIALFAALFLLLAACGDTVAPTAMPEKGVVASESGELEATALKGSQLSGLSGATNSSKTYVLRLPSGANNLKVTTSGGSGDVDLFVRRGQRASGNTYDCGSTSASNNETCRFSSASNTAFYMTLSGYSAFQGVTLKWTWDDGAGNPAPQPQPGGPTVDPCDLTSGLPC